jgi:hypothetical protein
MRAGQVSWVVRRKKGTKMAELVNSRVPDSTLRLAPGVSAGDVVEAIVRAALATPPDENVDWHLNNTFGIELEDFPSLYAQVYHGLVCWSRGNSGADSPGVESPVAQAMIQRLTRESSIFERVRQFVEVSLHYWRKNTEPGAAPDCGGTTAFRGS